MGDLGDFRIVDMLKMLLELLNFWNIDIGATRPGCSGTAATFVRRNLCSGPLFHVRCNIGT